MTGPPEDFLRGYIHYADISASVTGLECLILETGFSLPLCHNHHQYLITDIHNIRIAILALGHPRVFLVGECVERDGGVFSSFVTITVYFRETTTNTRTPLVTYFTTVLCSS